MVRANAERLWRAFLQSFFDRDHGFSRRYARAVPQAEDMGIDGKGFCAKCGVHYHIGGLTAHAGQSLQRVTVGGHFASMITHKDFRQSDDILRLVIVKANGFDVRFQTLQPKRDHLRGRLDLFEQSLCRLVYTHISRLRRARDSHQQLVRITIS